MSLPQFSTSMLFGIPFHSDATHAGRLMPPLIRASYYVSITFLLRPVKMSRTRIVLLFIGCRVILAPFKDDSRFYFRSAMLLDKCWTIYTIYAYSQQHIRLHTFVHISLLKKRNKIHQCLADIMLSVPSPLNIIIINTLTQIS